MYPLLPWNHRGWHGGGKSNNNYIGVEMTEPDTIRYTGGSSWEEIADGTNTKAHVLAIYTHAVELFAFLCNMFSLDPMEDGVIVSHSEGHKRGIASNHGDVVHWWSKFDYTMDDFRRDVAERMEDDNMTQEKLSQRMGVSRQTVSKWEWYVSSGLQYADYVGG